MEHNVQLVTRLSNFILLMQVTYVPVWIQHILIQPKTSVYLAQFYAKLVHKLHQLPAYPAILVVH